MKSIEHDVRVWFIVGIPNKKISNATLDQVLMEAKTHQDMLIGEHPRWTGSDYPWMVFNVYDSYYTLVRELYENLFHYIYTCIYIYNIVLINIDIWPSNLIVIFANFLHFRYRRR